MDIQNLVSDPQPPCLRNLARSTLTWQFRMQVYQAQVKIVQVSRSTSKNFDLEVTNVIVEDGKIDALWVFR